MGTPGRLGAHLRLGALGTGHVRCVVLDEADQMLGADFRVEIEALLAALPEGRQTLMFSATVSAEVEQMARRFQRDAQRLDLGAARGFELQGVAVAGADREAVVVNLLRLHEARAAIVFCARRDSAGSLAGRLAARGFAVAELSGAHEPGAGGTRRWRRCARGGFGSASRPISRHGDSTCRGWSSCCTPNCRGAQTSCCIVPGGRGGPGAAGWRCWW